MKLLSQRHLLNNLFPMLKQASYKLRIRSFFLGLAICFLVSFTFGCGGYYSATRHYQESLSRLDVDAALTETNKLLGVSSENNLPETNHPDVPLFLLERATLLQSMGRFKDSARDFQIADEGLEFLDFSGNVASTLSKYLYSEHKVPYRATPYEKSLVNTLNMINYLALGDLSGAKVEARRLRVAEEYMEGRESRENLIRLGTYLAGFTFEMAGDYASAMRFYADAYVRGGMQGIERVIRRLYQYSGFSDRRIRGLIKSRSRDLSRQKRSGGELLVIVALGRVPHKVPRRIPIGLAMANLVTGPRKYMSQNKLERAQKLMAEGAVKWLMLPEVELVPAHFKTVQLFLDQENVGMMEAMDLESLAIKTHEGRKGVYLAAALTRMLARFAVGKGVERIVKGKEKGPKKGGGAKFLGLLVEGALATMDRPDTRSWVSLPGQFYLVRMSLPARNYELKIVLGGELGERTITKGILIPDRGFKVIYITPFSDWERREKT